MLIFSQFNEGTTFNNGSHSGGSFGASYGSPSGGFGAHMARHSLRNRETAGRHAAGGGGGSGGGGVSGRKGNAYGAKFINIKRDVRVLDISCAKYHAVAVTTSGDVYTWGRQMQRQQQQQPDQSFQMTGLSGSLSGKQRQTQGCRGKQQYFQAKAQESSTYFEFSPPKLVSALRGKRVVKTSAGGDYTCVVTDMGDLYTWGSAAGKKCPRRVASLKRVVDVAVGDAHTIALMTCAKPKLPRKLPLRATRAIARRLRAKKSRRKRSRKRAARLAAAGSAAASDDEGRHAIGMPPDVIRRSGSSPSPAVRSSPGEEQDGSDASASESASSINSSSPASSDEDEDVPVFSGAAPALIALSDDEGEALRGGGGPVLAVGNEFAAIASPSRSTSKHSRKRRSSKKGGILSKQQKRNI